MKKIKIKNQMKNHYHPITCKRGQKGGKPFLI